MKKLWALALLLSTPLLAIETKYTDKTIDATENSAEFKIDGQIFASYEHADEENSGAPDTNGTAANLSGFNQNQGFNIPRAFVGIGGHMIDGTFKGYGFKITLDGGAILSSVSGTANSTTSTSNNSSGAELRHAYFYIPLYDTSWGKAEIRIGQQNIPLAEGLGGFSDAGTWGHRFIDPMPFERMGFYAASADRGVSIAHRSTYFGLHTMLGNGEGFRRNNAQAVFVPTGVSTGPGVTGLSATQAATIRTNLANLTNGNNGSAADSYGYDLYIEPSIHPTGDSKDVEFKIAVPVRMQNTTGIRRKEWEYTQMDLSTLTAANSLARLDFYHGDARAKQDVAVGPEGAFSMNLDFMKFTVGGGYASLKDKRSTSYRLDQHGIQTQINTANLAGANSVIDYTTFYNPDKDGYGQASFWYLHFRIKAGTAGSFGILARQIYGTGSTGTLSALPSKTYVQQLIELDIRDNRVGNGDVTLASTRGTSATIDLGKARFRNDLVALIWQPHGRLQFALGVNTLKTQNKDGERTKVSGFTNVGVIGGTGNAGDQLDTRIAANTGLPILHTDYMGVRRDNRQVFLRAAYTY